MSKQKKTLSERQTTQRLANALVFSMIVAAAGTVLPQSAVAEDTIWQQSTILGVPNGPKQALQDAGIDLSVNYTGFYQGLVSGEGDRDWEFGGKTGVIANFDGEKLGLWPGLYVNAHAEFIHGSNVLAQGDGSILPVNTALAFPTLGGSDTDLSLIVTQVFSEHTSLSVGKFNMLDAAAKTPLIGGGGLTTFMNTGLAAPISGVTPPYIIGGILSYKTEPANFTLMVYDPRNAQDEHVIRNPFEDGVTTSVSVTVPVDIAGRSGYHSVRGVYSTVDGTNFSDIPDLMLPPESRDIGTIDGYWFASYAVQQILVQDAEDPTKGWGLFGQIAVSDGNPNPFGWSGYIGLGGSSLFESRPDDRFGLAYFYYGFSDDLLDGLEELGFDYSDESGIEAYYNYAVTPWFNMTGDAQVIWPGAGDETAVFLGLRAQLKLF
jgi:porin